ncbi:MAG TPA: SgcJ/EcaC family oxidoreductase [Steroidobacteraceae bacterium]|nr:SgcJ/EcaC family oxidoreductase [Steroidobacteraceae bacterium]
MGGVAGRRETMTMLIRRPPGLPVALAALVVLVTTQPGFTNSAHAEPPAATDGPAQAAATRAAVEAATAAFHQALRTNDADAFMSFIADDVVLMPPGEAPVRGKSAVKAWYDGFLTQYRTTSLKLADVEVFVGDDWATEVGTYEWGLAPTAGGAPIVDRGNYMQVWQRRPDGQWRFAREVFNSSVPPPAAGTS